MRLLQCQDRNDFQNWETRYVLLLWLCVLCIIPFDICSMDSSLCTNLTTEGVCIDTLTSIPSHPSTPSLVQRIVSLALSYMSDAGPTRDAASACLSTLLTRPDMESIFLGEFINSAVLILRKWGCKTDDTVRDLTSS